MLADAGAFLKSSWKIVDLSRRELDHLQPRRGDLALMPVTVVHERDGCRALPQLRAQLPGAPARASMCACAPP
jgi:hypothetical protein